MTQPLLTIFPQYPWPGEPPDLTEGAYTGCYDSGMRQLVFIFEKEEQRGLIYASGSGWKRQFTMADGRLPEDIILNGSEAGWALACWRAALIKQGAR